MESYEQVLARVIDQEFMGPFVYYGLVSEWRRHSQVCQVPTGVCVNR